MAYILLMTIVDRINHHFKVIFYDVFVDGVSVEELE